MFNLLPDASNKGTRFRLAKGLLSINPGGRRAFPKLPVLTLGLGKRKHHLFECILGLTFICT